MNRISGALILCLSIAAIGCGPGGDWGGWLKGRDSWLLISDGVVRERLPRLSKTGTKELQIERATLRTEDMAEIGALQNLQYLRLTRCNINEDDFKYISRLQKLTRLDLAAENTPDSAVVSVGELRGLKSLRLGGNGITDNGIAHLAKLEQLEELTLMSNQVTDAGIVHLSHLPRLKSLDVPPRVTGSAFDSFGKLDSVRYLDLSSSAFDDDGMKNLAKFENLRTLNLWRTNVTDVGLMEVSGNYWLLNVFPSKHMTVVGMREFREKLLEGRRKAREMGLDVPPDDTLFIQTDKDPEVRGALPPRGYPKPQDD